MKKKFLVVIAIVIFGFIMVGYYLNYLAITNSNNWPIYTGKSSNGCPMYFCPHDKSILWAYGNPHVLGTVYYYCQKENIYWIYNRDAPFPWSGPFQGNPSELPGVQKIAENVEVN